MNFHLIKTFIKNEHTLDSSEWKGAVLFLCDNDSVVFIKRSPNMPTHGGQVAFIGGYKKDFEINPWDVVKREFTEETSLRDDLLDFGGYLPVVMTAKSQPIVPVFVRLIISAKEFMEHVRSNGEWDNCLSYPWEYLKIEKNWDFATRIGYSQSPILFHSLKKELCISKYPIDRSCLLWGATASMVWNLLQLYYANLKS